jgi:hypothetical protein
VLDANAYTRNDSLAVAASEVGSITQRRFDLPATYSGAAGTALSPKRPTFTG